MATTFNKIILVGHLSRDPELRFTATGTAMATFGLATNHQYKAGDTRQEEVCFLDVVVFGRQAEVVRDYLHKGNQALVEGRGPQARLVNEMHGETGHGDRKMPKCVQLGLLE